MAKFCVLRLPASEQAGVNAESLSDFRHRAAVLDHLFHRLDIEL